MEAVRAGAYMALRAARSAEQSWLEAGASATQRIAKVHHV